MRKYMNRKLRRGGFALLAAALLVALAGCAPVRTLPDALHGTATPSVAPSLDPTAAPSPTATPSPSPTAAPEPSATPTPEPTQGNASGRSIDPDQKMIALTFDDGPGAGTRRILSALDAADGRATFFMVGNRVEDYAETARKVAAQGSEIGTHTWSHPNLTKLSAAQVRRELERSMDVIERTTSARPTVLRPPYGSVNSTVRQVCVELGLAIANWNIDPEDWRVRDAQKVYRHIMNNARDGAIVVCHDLYPETAAALEMAIGELVERGYLLVTVSELLAARAGGGEAGRLYYSA